MRISHPCSCNENAGSTSSLDSLLGRLGEKFSLDNDWNLWELSFSEDLEETLLNAKD